MIETIRLCKYCAHDISSSHKNRKYCDLRCYEKSRYQEHGSRYTAAQRKKWYEDRKSKPGEKEKLRMQCNQRSKKVKDFIAAYKLKYGCADCGYDLHHAALDFDHVRDIKELNVCSAKSIKQAIKEISKCEVVCSNCHRIRSYNRYISRSIR